MATFSSEFPVPGTSARIRLQLIANQASQNIVNNTSTVNWTLQMVEWSNGGPWTSDNHGSSSAYVNGWVHSVNRLNYNFGSGTNITIVIASGSTVVAHNADGTKSVWCEGHAVDGADLIGNASVSGTLVLTTIPRGTQPSISPTAGETGSAFTITHTPASSAFFHDISYSLDGGSTFTNIATNKAGTSTTTSWTPAHTLLPNDTSKTAVVRVVTRATSGGTIIGTKDVNVDLSVPASVKPTVSNVTWVDAQTSAPNLPSLMGGTNRYVQKWSRPLPTVVSSPGLGSTVTSTLVTMAGQSTASGVAYPNPVNSSGAVSFAASATDTRGRSSDNYFNTVTVKAYEFPSLPTPTVTRTSDAAGLVPAPTGTYLRITPNASTSKLDFSGEKNLLEWQIRTRPKGGSWTVAQAWTNSTVSGNTIWTTPNVLAGFAASNEYEVEVSIRDLFGKNGFDTANTVQTRTIRVPSEEVFMDWNEGIGLGFGKYHSGSGARIQVAGGVDVEGGLSVDGVSILTSTTTVKGIVELATNAEAQAGSDDTRVVTPAALKSVTATETRAGLVELATQAEVNAGTDNTRYVTPLTLAGIALPPPQLVYYNGGNGNVGGSGGAFEDVSDLSTISVTASRPMIVRVDFSAYANAYVGYIMLGVETSGALVSTVYHTLGNAANSTYVFGAHTPYINGTGSAASSATIHGVKLVQLPAGTTTFKLRRMRSATGIVATSAYPTMVVTPMAWA